MKHSHNPTKINSFEEYIHFSRTLDELSNDAQEFYNLNIDSENFRNYRQYFDNYEDENMKIAITINEWLRFIQANTTTSLMKWAFFLKKDNDFVCKTRDEYVFNFFKKLEQEEKIGGQTFSKYVNDNWVPWSYYQNHFFHWFLNRYNIPYARAVFWDNPLGKYIHFFIAFAIFLIVSFRYFAPSIRSQFEVFPMITGIFTSVVFVLTIYSMIKNRFVYFIHSMVPRLGATIAIGYLFLLSTPDFVAKVYDNNGLFSERFQYFASAILIAFVLSFISLNIHKRVKPPLNFPEILACAFNIMIIGIAYALIGLLIFERILFNSVNHKTQTVLSTPCLSQLLFFCTVSLFIGVVFQLIWEEKPVTEPL